MERAEFRAGINNKRFITAMKAVGCIEEGILRNNMPAKQGTRKDSTILIFLKNE